MASLAGLGFQTQIIDGGIFAAGTEEHYEDGAASSLEEVQQAGCDAAWADLLL